MQGNERAIIAAARCSRLKDTSNPCASRGSGGASRLPRHGCVCAAALRARRAARPPGSDARTAGGSSGGPGPGAREQRGAARGEGASRSPLAPGGGRCLEIRSHGMGGGSEGLPGMVGRSVLGVGRRLVT